MSSIAKASGAIAVGTSNLIAGHCTLNSVQVITDGTNAATVTIYDSLTTAGKIISITKVLGATLHDSIVFVNPLRTDIGLTVVVAGTGASAYVGFGA